MCIDGGICLDVLIANAKNETGADVNFVKSTVLFAHGCTY